jgi:hypothetical protein
VIPERYWRPVSDIVWSWPSRAIVVLGLLAYIYLRLGGATAVAKGVAWVLGLIVVEWLVAKAWRRLVSAARAVHGKPTASN